MRKENNNEFWKASSCLCIATLCFPLFILAAMAFSRFENINSGICLLSQDPGSCIFKIVLFCRVWCIRKSGFDSVFLIEHFAAETCQMFFVICGRFISIIAVKRIIR